MTALTAASHDDAVIAAARALLADDEQPHPCKHVDRVSGFGECVNDAAPGWDYCDDHAALEGRWPA